MKHFTLHTSRFANDQTSYTKISGLEVVCFHTIGPMNMWSLLVWREAILSGNSSTRGSVPKHNKGVFPTVDSTLGLELSEPDLDQSTGSTSEKAEKKYLNKDTTTGYKVLGGTVICNQFVHAHMTVPPL